MTLVLPTHDLGPAAPSVPVPVAAVPAQRPSTDTVAACGLSAAADAARQALSGTGRNDRDAVVWLSEHIATLDRVVYPLAARHLHEPRELRDQQAATHRLALLVRRLHAQLAGDGAAGYEDVPALRDAVVAALDEHSVAERHLLARLREQLTVSQWSELCREHAERLQRGPTRPHPHTPRTGAAGRLAYRLSAWVDHVLDVVDSRPVRPVPLAS